ncbi:MAG: hypothetical protein V4618_11870 [Pseudomonadota bacterium]
MAKDPNYDRYAGIESSPGLDGKMPPPFRVDEDGNVIYRDRETGLAQPDRLAPAEILSWDELDRKATEDRLAKLVGEGAEPLVDLPLFLSDKVSGTRKRIGGVDYDVISANTYDPARSNGRTGIPNADMIATMNADKRQIAVTDPRAIDEAATRIIRLPIDFRGQFDNRPASEKNLPLTNPKSDMLYSLPVIDPETKKRGRASTLRFGKLSDGTVALGHGHIDKGPEQSDGVIDVWDPSQDLYGDVESLLGDNPMPMATVSNGRVGWHQLDNGRVQFMYPSGLLSKHEVDAIQANLDKQQRMFQRKIP